MFEDFFIPLLVGLICLWVGFRLGSGNDAALKRKRFRNYIELLTKKVESTLLMNLAWNDPKVFRDIPKFETEVLEVRPHICDRKKVGFDDACAAYKTMRFGDIGTVETNAEAEKTKAKLVALLGEISRLAR